MARTTGYSCIEVVKILLDSNYEMFPYGVMAPEDFAKHMDGGKFELMIENLKEAGIKIEKIVE